MNLVIASYNLKDPEAWRLALGVDKVIDLRSEDKLRSFADIALALDELIYSDKYPIDWVLYCNNEKGIKWAEFLEIESRYETRSDTIILTQTKTSERENGPGFQIPDLTGNFYCRPHVFNMLGGLYKLKINHTNVLTETKSPIDDTKILYGITRAGFDLSII